jgi:uncharacterized protein (TIGR00369 family)
MSHADGDAYTRHVTEGLIELPLLKSLGIRAVETPANGHVVLEFTNDAMMMSPLGAALGASLLALIDVTASVSAVFAWREKGAVSSAFATQDLSVQFLLPARSTPIRAHAVPVRISARRAVVEVTVTDGEQTGLPVAIGLVSVRCFPASRIE